ncbi:MAG: hypothetical protein WC657_05675 [Candidatus Paceibacterota bacterium]|jgi:hypothetical protein
MDPILAAAVIVAEMLIKTGAIPPPPTQKDADLLLNKCYELVQTKANELRATALAVQSAGNGILN